MSFKLVSEAQSLKLHTFNILCTLLQISFWVNIYSPQEYLDLVQKFKATNVELAGIGVQSRFQDLTEPDITLIKVFCCVLYKT